MERHLSLRFESIDLGALDAAIARMTQTLLHCGAKIVGPFPLPTRVERDNVLSGLSTREYAVYTHKRILPIIDPQAMIIQNVSALDVPPGVDIKEKEQKRPVDL